MREAETLAALAPHKEGQRAAEHVRFTNNEATQFRGGSQRGVLSAKFVEEFRARARAMAVP